MVKQDCFAEETLCDLDLPIIFVKNVKKFDGFFTTLNKRTIEISDQYARRNLVRVLRIVEAHNSIVNDALLKKLRYE
jgi:hypothetical protein